MRKNNDHGSYQHKWQPHTQTIKQTLQAAHQRLSIRWNRRKRRSLNQFAFPTAMSAAIVILHLKITNAVSFKKFTP